jgi:hypothetical protein
MSNGRKEVGFTCLGVSFRKGIDRWASFDWRIDFLFFILLRLDSLFNIEFLNCFPGELVSPDWLSSL